MKKYLHTLFAITSLSVSASDGWIVTGINAKRFIENKSQFDGRDKQTDSKILFGVEEGGTQIYFTKHGLTYRVDKTEPKKEVWEEEFENKKEESASLTDVVQMQWQNANPNVQVIAEEKTDDYFSYTIGNKNINYIKGYKKLIYKNLYPNIDVEYVFHEKVGIKYSIILHSGADISNVQMIYSKNIFSDSEGKLHMPTLAGDIIDHTPQTFYADDNLNGIVSKFILNENSISFSLGNYDKTKTIVIDPWVQTPVLPSSNCVWECERDGSGNVYIIGGDSPMKLQKYNPSGTLQWTYNTPYDTANDWLGTFATDLKGNSYVTSGSIAAMQKINTNAGLVWNYPAPSQSEDEYWSLTFNCDQTKLVAGGTRLKFDTAFQIVGYGMAFNIDMNTGAVIDTDIVASIFPVKIFTSIINDPNEIRAICSSPYGDYYFLTLDTIGSINNSFVNKFIHHSGDTLGYKCENYRPKGNGGICSIKANESFLYTQNGASVQKRSLATGLVLTNVAIPGGISTVVSNTTPKSSMVGNSGIDIDTCGNVYVGSGNAIIKYDASLNFISSVSLPFAVYDVIVNNNGEVVVAGATGTSSSTLRTGYVQSINMSACLPMDTICVSNPTSVQENSFNGSNLILENISSDNYLNGIFFATENSEMQVEIIDLLGRIIEKEKFSSVKGANHLHFDLANMNAGTYFMRMYNSKSTITGRFLKL